MTDAEIRQATYLLGWRAFDRGGSHRKARRMFAKRVDENPEALALWDAGWADNQHGRPCTTSLTTPTTGD